MLNPQSVSQIWPVEPGNPAHRAPHDWKFGARRMVVINIDTPPPPLNFQALSSWIGPNWADPAQADGVPFLSIWIGLIQPCLNSLVRTWCRQSQGAGAWGSQSGLGPRGLDWALVRHFHTAVLGLATWDCMGPQLGPRQLAWAPSVPTPHTRSGTQTGPDLWIDLAPLIQPTNQELLIQPMDWALLVYKLQIYPVFIVMAFIRLRKAPIFQIPFKPP